MSKNINLQKLVNYTKTFIILLIFASLAYFILSENILDYVILTNLPIINIKKLLLITLISNILLLGSNLSLGIFFFKIYNQLRIKGIPFASLLWILGGLNFAACASFVVASLNLWRTYFWMGAIVKVGITIFSVGAAIAIAKSYQAIKNIKSPEHYQNLKDEIEKVSKIQQDILNIKSTKD